MWSDWRALLAWSGVAACFAAIAQCVPDDIKDVGYKVFLGSRKYFVSVDVGGDSGPRGDGHHYFLHNHLRFTVLFHRDSETDLARIVGFEVEPFSVKHTYETPWDAIKPKLDTCSPGRMKYVTHGLEPQAVKEEFFIWLILYGQP